MSLGEKEAFEIKKEEIIRKIRKRIKQE